MSETSNLIGESPAFQKTLAHVSALAPLDRPVLIIGERGTGKELIAHRLNFLSARWNKPFLTLNCGALSESVLDSELFGHEAGAFTGGGTAAGEPVRACGRRHDVFGRDRQRDGCGAGKAAAADRIWHV